MPVSLDFLEEGEIVRVKFSDPWTGAEMVRAFESDQAHRDQIQRKHPGTKVHLIIDFSQAETAADHALTVRKSPSLAHPTSGSVVIVGANTLFKNLVKMAFRLSHYEKAVFVKTMDQALDHLREMQAMDKR